jgi:3',5'-cyclic AMP phosphodiesterase CpdA
MSSRFVLAQISDPHVRADDDGASARQMARALAATADYRPDLILVTGDLVNDERADEYAVFAEAIAGAPAPTFVLPGNHDRRARMRQALPGHRYLPEADPLSYVIDEHAVRVVVIDQIVPSETHGVLTEAQAKWLDSVLAAAPTKPTVVALHHPPFMTHDRLFDQIGLRDADLLARTIDKHRHVERVICGHHHRVVFGQCAHAPVIVAPSTAWTYGLALHEDQAIAPRTSEPCGWMLHVRDESSGFASHFMGFSTA